MGQFLKSKIMEIPITILRIGIEMRKKNSLMMNYFFILLNSLSIEPSIK